MMARLLHATVSFAEDDASGEWRFPGRPNPRKTNYRLLIFMVVARAEVIPIRTLGADDAAAILTLARRNRRQ